MKTVKNKNMMKKLNNETDYCDHYYENIKAIVSHTKDDFEKQMNTLDQKKLFDIRNFISSKLLISLKIDKYDLKLITRKGSGKKRSYIDDIYVLSHFLVDGNFGIEFDNIYRLSIEPSKIFKPELINNQIIITSAHEDMQEIANQMKELISTMNDVKGKVSGIENKVDGVISDNRAIRAEIAGMKNEINQINNTIQNDSKTRLDSMETFEHMAENGYNTKKRKHCSNQIDTLIDGNSNRLLGQGQMHHVTQQSVRRKHIVHGSKSSSDIKTSSNKFGVYIGGIDCNESIDKVSTLLDNLNLKHTGLTLLDTTIVDRKFNSYKFYVTYDQKNIIYNHENWPKGIIVKKYTEYRQFNNLNHQNKMSAYGNNRQSSTPFCPKNLNKLTAENFNSINPIYN
jgi:hypothetical protein